MQTSARASAALFLLVALGCAEGIQFLKKPQPQQKHLQQLKTEEKGTLAQHKTESGVTKPKEAKGQQGHHLGKIAQATRTRLLAALRKRKPTKKASAAEKAKLQKLKAALKKPKTHALGIFRAAAAKASKEKTSAEKKHTESPIREARPSVSEATAPVALECPPGMSQEDCEKMHAEAAQHGGSHAGAEGGCPDGLSEDECKQMSGSHAMEGSEECKPADVLREFGGEIPDEDDAQAAVVAERCPMGDPLCVCIETEIAEACFPRDCLNCLEGNAESCEAYGQAPTDVCECVADYDAQEDMLWETDPSYFDADGNPIMYDDMDEPIMSTGDAIIATCYEQHDEPEYDKYDTGAASED